MVLIELKAKDQHSDPS